LPGRRFFCCCGFCRNVPRRSRRRPLCQNRRPSHWKGSIQCLAWPGRLPLRLHGGDERLTRWTSSGTGPAHCGPARVRRFFTSHGPPASTPQGVMLECGCTGRLLRLGVRAGIRASWLRVSTSSRAQRLSRRVLAAWDLLGSTRCYLQDRDRPTIYSSPTFWRRAMRDSQHLRGWLTTLDRALAGSRAHACRRPTGRQRGRCLAWTNCSRVPGIRGWSMADRYRGSNVSRR